MSDDFQRSPSAIAGALRSITRRGILKAAAGVSAASILGSASAQSNKETGLRLGMAGYTLRDFKVEDIIPILKGLRIENAALFRTQLNLAEASIEQSSAAARAFEAAGMRITGTGVVGLPADEKKCRKIFENAKAARVATVVCAPQPDSFPLVERLAKEFDQRVAVHNHGPEDPLYPTPYDAMNKIESLDRRIGLCIDVGHTYRAQVDPVEAIRQCAGRVLDIHMKDSLATPGARRDVPVEVGAGHLDIPGIVKALRSIRYDGVVSFEYEVESPNLVAGLAESIGYVRGILSEQETS